jgi:hypothetical protein
MATSAMKLILIFNNADLTPFASAASPVLPDKLLTVRHRFPPLSSMHFPWSLIHFARTVTTLLRCATGYGAGFGAELFPRSSYSAEVTPTLAG